MSALSVNQSVSGYRSASALEAMAMRIGAGLVAWAERRRAVPEETAGCSGTPRGAGMN